MKRRLRGLLAILEKMGRSEFELRVYRAVSSIPWGETRNYAWVARRIGCQAGARAVGQALKRNPLPLAIPCHRVTRREGSPGGFSCGAALKKRLLAAEKADII